MKWPRSAAVFFFAVSVFAQRAAPPFDTSQPTGTDQPGAADQPNLLLRSDPTDNPVTLARSESASPNFFNAYAFVNGVFDSNNSAQTAALNPTLANQDSFGFEGGGGVTANHLFRHGSFSLSYRGSYRHYDNNNSFYQSGTNQNLNFDFRRSLGRRWIVDYSQYGGVFLNGGTYFNSQPAQSGPTQLNPLSNSTRFLDGAVTLTYRQSYRLSYQLGGDYYITRYSTAGAFGTTGGSGNAAILYRWTRRTTVSANYSHSNYSYQNAAGNSSVNNIFLRGSHDFSTRWRATVSAGISQVSSSGNLRFFVNPELAALIGSNYVTGTYKSSSVLPYFDAGVSRLWRYAQLSVNGGQSVSSGNGVYLTSRNLHINGYYSYTLRRYSLGIGGNYSRLGSVSNTAGNYKSGTFSASLGYNWLRHLGLNLRYDYTSYGGLGTIASRDDSRIAFGFVFTAKEVPITLF